MKKIYLFILFVSLLSGCKKKPFDYRNKFLGEYDFVVYVISYDPYNVSHDTTYAREGEILYGSTDNTILISFKNGGSTEFTIFEDGTLDGNGCKGEFESTKKVKYHCFCHSPGSETDSYITGDKK